MGLSQRSPKILPASTHRDTIVIRCLNRICTVIGASTLYLHVILKNLGVADLSYEDRNL
jgi:hypothetical protein